METKSRFYYYRITHSTAIDAATKSDMFSSLMQSNLGGLSMNQSTSPATAAVAPAAQLALPYNASSNNTGSWHSANPLVLNHQLASPQTNSNNNFSSLDDLDPFGSASNQAVKPNNANGANMYTLQQPTVNYIYPTGYNSANSLNSMQQSIGLNKPINPPTLMPQAQMTQSPDSKNLNTLSQQDILNFLN